MVGRLKEESAYTSGVEPVSFLIRLVPVIGEGEFITEIESEYGDAVLLEVPGHPYVFISSVFLTSKKNLKCVHPWRYCRVLVTTYALPSQWSVFCLQVHSAWT